MALYPDGRVSHNKTEFVQNVAVNRCSWDAILHNTADILTINKTCKLDVKTAITICRAKSEPCKNQITDVACRLYNNNLIPKKLPRFCQREGEALILNYLFIYLFIHTQPPIYSPILTSEG